MAVRVTQAGAEAAVQGGAAARVTQAGLEAAVQGGAAARVTQSGIEVLTDNPQTPSSGGCAAVASGSLAYRLRIRNEDDDADELVISSLASDTNPYLEGPPDGDGQSIDPVRGTSDIGAFRGRVIDAITSGTDRVVTEALSDSGGYQLLGRRAYWEESDDDGGSWTVLVAGYVNRLTLDNALVWDFEIGEARRTERTRKLFVEAETPFDRTSNIIGTPIRGGFGPLQDFGGWRMEVDSVSPGVVTLDFIEGVLYTQNPFSATRDFIVRRGSMSDAELNHINNVLAKPFALIETPVPANDIAGRFPGLIARVEQADGTLLGHFTPLVRAANSIPLLFQYWLVDIRSDAISLEWSASQPNPGDEVFLWIGPRNIDQRNPVHITGHPVDLAADAMELAGASLDAIQQAVTKATIGDDAFVSLRITQSMSVSEFVDMLGQAYGFTTRAGTDGEIEFIPTRNVVSLPSTTITKDCLRGEGTPFSLEEKTLINSLTVTQTLFDTWLDSDEGQQPYDFIKAIPESVTYNNGETLKKGEHPLEVEIPGRLEIRQTSQLDSQSGTPLDFDQFVTQLGNDLFARFGRGADTAELPLLRGETAQVGDLLILDLDYLPNGNVRGGQKIVQVVQATPTPEGTDIRVMAIAVNLQTATVPVFTVTANATDGLHLADITLTNAGSLPAGGLVRVEWAIGSLITSGTFLALLDYGAGELAVTTPLVPAGSIVSARMRVEIPGQLPGAWTGWQSVDLTDLQAPSGLAAVQVDASSFDISWTNTETDYLVEVMLKLASDPAFTTNPRFPLALLQPGSDRFRITGLTSGVAYTAGVRYRDISLAWPGSAISTVALNPSGTAPVLNPPTAPVAWAGRLGPGGVRQIDGTFGMDVLASEIPSFVEFELALETAVGSGTAGAFSRVATVDSVQGGVTRFQAVAPNDGRLRYMRARHTRAGSTASSYTATVSVNPWSPQAPGQATDAEVLLRAVSTAFPSGRVVVDGDIAFDFTVANQVTGHVGDDGRTITIMAQFGDGVAQPNVNGRCGIRLPYDLDVLDWMIWADASGSAVVDVRRTDYATFSFASIAASAKPTLSTAIKNQDTTLTGWTIALDADDLLDFLLESLTTCKLVVVALKCRRRIS